MKLNEKYFRQKTPLTCHLDEQTDNYIHYKDSGFM